MTLVAEPTYNDDTPVVLEALSEEEAYLFALLSDPSGLDQAEFLWHDPSSDDNFKEVDGKRTQVRPSPSGCFRAWAYQWPWWRTNRINQIDCCARSVGKALDVETPIPTPNGWKRLGDIVVGDEVFNELGEPVAVLEAFDVMYGRPCYEVEFDEGSTLVADADHQWRTWTKTDWARRRRGSVEAAPAVRTTREIAESVRHVTKSAAERGKSEANHRIEVAGALQLPAKKLKHETAREHVRWRPSEEGDDPDALEVHPYVLGYWLGDGDSNRGGLTVGSQDLDEITALFEEYGYGLHKLKSSSTHFRIVPACDRVKYTYLESTGEPQKLHARSKLTNEDVNELRWQLACAEVDNSRLIDVVKDFEIEMDSALKLFQGRFRRDAGGPIRDLKSGDTVGAVLRRMGICAGNGKDYQRGVSLKRIPPKYERASVEQRILLLQGIMDSDGHCHKAGGRCEITLKSEELIHDVRALLSSLGQRSFLDKRRARCNGVDAGVVYRITFAPRDLQPFRLKRKAERVTPLSTNGESRTSARRIVNVREVPTRPVRCIAVDGPSHLFLAGETMIPTHNSLSIMVRACAFPFLFPGQEMVITAPELVHLEPIVSLIENRMFSTRALRELLPRGKSAVTHRPFQINFINGARIIGRIPQRDGRGVKGCVAGDTLVLTREGYKPAEEIRVGDEVLTHESRFRPVTAVFEDENDCYEVRGQSSFPMVVSCDHRFYGAENSATRKQRRSFLPLSWHDVEHLTEHQVYWASPTGVPGQVAPEIDATWSRIMSQRLFWWLVGRYLADGHTDPLRVLWCAPEGKQDGLVAALDHLGLHHYKIDRQHSSAAMRVHCSVTLAAWLREQFGSHAADKRLPTWALGMSVDFRQALLDGYLAGDGWFHQERKRWEVSTASKVLATGMQVLAQSLGFTVNCSMTQPKTTHIAGVELKAKPKMAWRLQILDGVPVEVDAHACTYRLGKVKSVTPVGIRKVYDIRVAEDHSYLTGSVMSHNIHPIWLELDEAQDYPHAGWVELRETLKRGFEGAMWRAHGVTKGVRDDFYEFTQDSPDNPWVVHHFAAMWRPNWTDEERSEAILKYGSREDPDYRRNVLGLHGDKTNPIFVLTQLMKNVDEDKLGEYNSSEYFKAQIKIEQLQLWDHDITESLDFPPAHLAYAGKTPRERLDNPQAIYWCGMDIGFTIDPSEILVFVEYRPKPREPKTVFRLLSRVSLTRMPHHEQIQAILHTVDFYRPKAFSMDKGGNGLPLFQEMQEHIDAFRAKDWERIPAWMRRYDLEFVLDCIKGYNFSEKLVVGLDKSIELSPYADNEDVISESGMKRNAKEFSTDMLREFVDGQRLWLPWDEDLLKQFQGGTWTSNKSMDAYGRRIFSHGNDHCLDAARMFALGQSLHSIEEMMRKEPAAPVYASFL